MRTTILMCGLLLPMLCVFAQEPDAPVLKKKPPVAEEKKVDPKKPEAKQDEKPEAKKEEPDAKKGDADEKNPEKLKERIIRNSKAAGERIEGQDTGEETRKLQDQNVKDIDELLKQLQNPPDSGGGGGSPPPPSGSGGSPPPSGGATKSGGMPPPSGQSGPSSGGSKSSAQRRQERQQQQASGSGKDRSDSPSEGGKDKKDGGAGGKEQGSNAGKEDRTAKEKGGTSGTNPKEGPGGKDKDEKTANGGGQGTVGEKPKSEEPKKTAMNEKDAEKYRDVWGHLPEKLRQEMELYFREQLDPQHAEMLRQYYSALAERNRRRSK